MKYSVDIHEMVFPKYAKLQFKVNRAGNLTLIASPSYTPGKLPDGLKPGQIPKGTRIFDYDSQIVVSLTFQDCLNIIEFAKSRNVANTVELFRNSDKYNKKVTISYFPDEANALKPKFVTIWFNSSEASGKEINFKLPLSLSNLDEIAELVKSYVHGFVMIKLFCQEQLQEQPQE